jgi:hypothetical protein
LLRLPLSRTATADSLVLHHILAVAEDHLTSTRILVAALQWSLGFFLHVTTISYNLYLDGCLFREMHTRNGLWRERVSAAQSYGAG